MAAIPLRVNGSFLRLLGSRLMLKLAYDFSRRAVSTLRGLPIAQEAERADCEWREVDLNADISPVVRTNDFNQLSDSVLGVANNYKHSRGRGFQDHLQGVAGLLLRWQQEPLIVQVGLLHSAYSTQQYPYGLFSYAERFKLAELIGPDAERLTFIFCSHDRVDLYAQAIALCKRGVGLPDEGLVLRNALTGSSALVPASIVARLLVVHAADLAEQMDGFNFEIIAALLAGAESRLALPACFEVLKEHGVGGSNLSISIDPARGTFGLAPVLGLDRSLLADRLTLARLLRGTGALDDRAEAKLREIDGRRPALFEVPWIRLQRRIPGGHKLSAEKLSSQLAEDTEASDWLLEARARHTAWGVPWLKRPFDNNPTYRALIL